MNLDRTKFYDKLRNGTLLGPVVTTSEFYGIEAILNETLKYGWGPGWIAYALATAYHETAHTMQPIREMGGSKYLTKMYDIEGNRPTMAKQHGNTSRGDGIKYCGRGFVQLTWKSNYVKAAAKLNMPEIVENPAIVMNIDVASKILRQGMEEGWFSGAKLSKYIPDKNAFATKADFEACRKIINGVDKKELIADYAIMFQKDLLAST